MIKNYFITSLRNLTRNKGYTVVNVLGLTFGISGCLVLLLLVQHLYNFDADIPDRNQVYRVVTESNYDGYQDFTPGVPLVLPDALRSFVDGSVEIGLISYFVSGQISYSVMGEQRNLLETEGITYADEHYFSVFNREIIKGKRKEGLKNPNEVYLSEKVAKKLFSGQEALGKVITLDRKTEFTVVGIVKDYGKNSHFPFDYILSYSSLPAPDSEQGWYSISSDDQCYLRIPESINVSNLENTIESGLGQFLDEETSKERIHRLQSIEDMHFDANYSNYTYENMSKAQVSACLVIALFLLVTASINFINLSTANAVKRAKEVGIRKTLGSGRGPIISQIMGETFLITFIAIVLSLGLTELILLWIKPYIAVEVALSFGNNIWIWVYLIAILFFVSVLSGLYPSIVIAGYNPITALKNNNFNKSKKGTHVRKGLVVFQFVIGQMMVIGTLIVYEQIQFFQNKELGFRTDSIVSSYLPVNDKNQLDQLRVELLKIGSVKEVSYASANPSSGSISASNFNEKGKDQEFQTFIKNVDAQYYALFNLEFLAGKVYQDKDSAKQVVINESLYQMLGYNTPEEVIGKEFRLHRANYQVVGVVKDFHQQSLEAPIEPLIMRPYRFRYSSAAVHFKDANLARTVKNIEVAWKKVFPEYVFEYELYEDHIEEYYDQERNMAIIFTGFSILSIVIGGLGLFGLVSFMVNQKLKEIGIRKVLGASEGSILFTFGKEFVVLIGVAFVLAAPIAYWSMGAWLNTYTYRMEMHWMHFASGFLLTVIVCFLTVGAKSVKAAVSNPIESLKDE